MNMKGYLIANYNVDDADTYSKYREKVSSVVEQYGGKFVIATTNTEVLEGEPGKNMVVVEFESVDAVKRFYNSPEYEAIKDLHTNSIDGWLQIAEESSA